MSDKTRDILWRGICGRCPKCGKGGLFKSYLKPKDACSACGLDLSQIRADDGPPWLTILLTGHIVTPLILFFVKHDIFSEWMEMTILFILTMACIFLILPRAKGFFIAAIWMSSEKNA